MVVIWTESAKNDLKNYIQNSKILSNDKIKKYINNLVKYANELKDYPYLGKNFYEYKNILVRQLLYKMHRILYFVQDKNIIIIMVTHTSRDLTNIINIIKNIIVN